MIQQVKDNYGRNTRTFNVEGEKYFIHRTFGDLWVVGTRKSQEPRVIEYSFVLPNEGRIQFFPMSKPPIILRADILEHLGGEMIFGFPLYDLVKGLDKSTAYIIRFSQDPPHRVELVKKVPLNATLIFDKEDFVGFAIRPTFLPLKDGKLYPPIN